MPEVIEETIEQARTRIYDEVRKEFEERHQVWKAKDLADLAEKQQSTIREEVAKLVKEYQDQQKPLTPEQIQKLLDQEYAEVEVKLSVRVPNHEGQVKKNFTIRELPQTVERKFYREFTEKIKKEGPKLAAFQQRSMDKPFEQVMGDFMDAFDGGFDILASAVSIILNPFGEEKEVTPEWVAQNISSNRQYSIVLAQAEVNKLRDFFSRVFQSGQKAGTILMPQSSRL